MDLQEFLSKMREFLITRKQALLELEKRAVGVAKVAVVVQIQDMEAMLMFLNTNRTEADMAKLQLTLDTVAQPIVRSRSNQDDSELAEAIIELAKKLEQQVKNAKGEIGFKLNNLPPGTPPSKMVSKIYGMRARGRISPNCKPSLQPVIDEKTKQPVIDPETGKVKKIAVLTMKPQED